MFTRKIRLTLCVSKYPMKKKRILERNSRFVKHTFEVFRYSLNILILSSNDHKPKMISKIMIAVNVEVRTQSSQW